MSNHWEVNNGNEEDCQSQNSHGLTNPPKNNEERKKRPDNGKIPQRLKSASNLFRLNEITIVFTIDNSIFPISQ